MRLIMLWNAASSPMAHWMAQVRLVSRSLLAHSRSEVSIGFRALPPLPHNVLGVTAITLNGSPRADTACSVIKDTQRQFVISILSGPLLRNELGSRIRLSSSFPVPSDGSRPEQVTFEFTLVRPSRLSLRDATVARFHHPRREVACRSPVA